MAIITFLFSLAVKQANNIIQIIFGWSVTTLFGKLQRRPQVLVTTALVLSLAWPVFIIGAIWPKVATWAIAFVPLHDSVGALVMRIVWLAIAVIAPPIVGILVHIAAKQRRGTIARAMIGGYPIALGFFAAFLTVVVTVPLVKLASLAHRWSDEHVFVQPRDGKYEDTIEQLADAVRRAGLEPHIGDVPRHLVLATSIMRFMAKSAVEPFVAQTLKRVIAPGIEIYLYPADLLIRGKTETVAHVRALFMRTHLDAYAYLVQSEKAQAIQDRFAKLGERISDGEQHGNALTRELCDAYRELFETDLPFEDVLALETLARRLERSLASAIMLRGARLPLDAVGDREPVGEPSIPTPIYDRLSSATARTTH